MFNVERGEELIQEIILFVTGNTLCVISKDKLCVKCIAIFLATSYCLHLLCTWSSNVGKILALQFTIYKAFKNINLRFQIDFLPALQHHVNHFEIGLS